MTIRYSWRLSQTEHLSSSLISAVDDVWVLYTSHLQASTPISKRFLRESLSIANAAVPITCHGSSDLITYGLTEDQLINWIVSNVERLCFRRISLNYQTSCADLTDVTVNFSSSELKKTFALNFFREYQKQKLGTKNLGVCIFSYSGC